MLLADVAAVSESVRATSSRREKATAIADLLLSTTARDPDPDLDSVTRYLLGTPRQRRLGVGPAALRELPPPADDPTLSVGDVDAFFQAMAEASGPGSAGLRRRLLRELMGRATTREQRLLVGLVGGDLRQGAAAGVMTEAAQVASSVPSAAIRRAVLVCGSLPEVVVAAMNGGEAAVDAIGMRMGIPMAPMLASSAPTVAQAMAAIDGPVAVEHKLDGIRVQAHRDGEDVRVFSRSGDDITKRLPEVVAAVRTIPVRSVVLDGEALVWGDDGRPASFQTTGSRVGRNDAPADLGSVPGSVRAVFFDLLHLDGIDRFGESSAVRRHLLEQVVPDALLVPRLETGDVDIAQRFY